MALSAFADRTHSPSEQDLTEAMGDAYPAWCELLSRAKESLKLSEEWGFSSPKTGWGLRLRSGKRAILYMTPCEGYLLASLALGEKAVLAAKRAGLPEWVWNAVEEAPRYVEGRGVRLKVTSAEQVAAVLKLAEVKKNH